MSAKHPIIAVTGSAGAGTTTVRHAFADIFRRQGLKAAFVKGNSFFRHELAERERLREEAARAGKPITLFGPELNMFDRLEQTFAEYGKTGMTQVREYVKDADDAQRLGLPIGTFTPWRRIEPGTDLLFYEGMHGGVAAHTWTRRRSNAPPPAGSGTERRGKGNGGVNAAQHVDLLLGVVPALNLEWIQKIHRDCSDGGCSVEESTQIILRRLRDYTYFIVPQFTLTDINFQRMPLVDTSNPFIARDIPSADESIVVIHFRDPHKFHFPNLLKRIHGAFMSRPNTMVIPGGKLRHALEVICGPLIAELMEGRRRTGARA